MHADGVTYVANYGEIITLGSDGDRELVPAVGRANPEEGTESRQDAAAGCGPNRSGGGYRESPRCCCRLQAEPIRRRVQKIAKMLLPMQAGPIRRKEQKVIKKLGEPWLRKRRN